MSQQEQEPTFYALEFDSDVTFWPGGDASTRRTYLMPLRTPAEFLAFGVLAPMDQVIFVARGQVEAHLEDFISRMRQAGASVELYARPALPGSLLRRYARGGPVEQREPEPPPDPPPGVVGDEPARSLMLSELSGESPLWPEEGASTRQTLFVLLPGETEFLAIGVFQKPQDARGHFRTPFVARGSVREHLGTFISRMQREGARVEFHARPPLRSLEEYVARHFPGAFEQGSASLAAKAEAGGAALHEVHA